MYKIVGADGQEYGPVSAAQLRQWIAEQRLNAQTLVQAEGDAAWKPAGTVPEFSLLFLPRSTPMASGTPATAPSPRTSGFALAGLVMGVFAVTLGLCCCYGIPFNFLGVIFSLIALSQIKRHPEAYTGRGLAVAGLILSLLSIALAAAALAVGVAVGWPDIMRELNKI